MHSGNMRTSVFSIKNPQMLLVKNRYKFRVEVRGPPPRKNLKVCDPKLLKFSIIFSAMPRGTDQKAIFDECERECVGLSGLCNILNTSYNSF